MKNQVKSFEEAYQLLDPIAQKRYDETLSVLNTPDEVAYKKLKLIAQVLRGDWVPYWSNTDQRKWFPIFEWSAGSGIGFSDSDFGYSDAVTTVGSRLCFPTQEMSDYFGRQFIEIHREMLTL